MLLQKLKMNRYEPVAVSALISFAKLANDRAIVNPTGQNPRPPLYETEGRASGPARCSGRKTGADRVSGV